MLGHADGGQRRVHAGLQRLPGDAEVGGPEGDVLGHGGQEELVVRVLEDDPDPAPDLPEVPARHGETADGYRAVARREDPVEVQHQGGLAGAVRAEQGHPLAALDPEVDPVERLVAVRVGEGEPADVERRRGCGGVCPRDRHRHRLRRGTHVITQPVTASAAATATGERPVSQWRRVVTASESRGIRPVKPRDSIARCTRSPRS